MKSFKILSIFLLLFCAPQLQVDSEAQIPIKKCSVCGRPVSNCDYKGNHPKCSVCGKVKEQCPYKGKHPKCSTCGKLKEQCPYKGKHPVPIQKETFTANGVSFVMIKVESNGRTYYIGETEVTQVLWQAVMGGNPSFNKGSQRPVEMVNCNDCEQFIRKLNSLTGKTFRLPTEDEWEYAAKGGKYTHGYEYSGSNNIDEVAWYYDNSNLGTHEVKTKRPNELGIYDMSGNVWEWTSTMYDRSLRVRRGGGWGNIAKHCRSANRDSNMPIARFNYNGFRLAL